MVPGMPKRSRSRALGTNPIGTSNAVGSAATPTPPAYSEPLLATSSAPSASGSCPSVETSGSMSNTRGRTRGVGLSKSIKALGKKMEIHISKTDGRPINATQSAKLSSELGIISREFLPCPRSWRKLNEEVKKPAFDQLSKHLDIIGITEDAEVYKRVEKILSRRSKDTRYRLHKHFLTHGPNNRPKNVSKENWTDLCIYWSMPDTKERCRKARDARAQVKTLHTSGSKAFVSRRHEISQQELDCGECDRITLYHRTHYKPRNESEPGRWISDVAEQRYHRMLEL